MTLRALTIRQPWAWAILHAGKDVENRVWETDYRGTIAVHAGVVTAPGARQRLADLGLDILSGLPKGAIVGLVDVVDCVRDSTSRWAVGEHWHWLLANPRPLAEPVPCKGKLSLWHAPDDVEEAVRTQLGSAERRDTAPIHR